MPDIAAVDCHILDKAHLAAALAGRTLVVAADSHKSPAAGPVDEPVVQTENIHEKNHGKKYKNYNLHGIFSNVLNL